MFDPSIGESENMDFEQSENVENPVLRKAKLLRLRTNKLLEAFHSSNAELTKQLLIDVELDLSELEIDPLTGLNDEEYNNISAILASGRESVKNVNAAFSLISGIGPKIISNSESEPFEFEDVKIRFKPFQFYGDIKEWHAFWDRYNVQIHSRKLLSKITKFTFLLECLRNKALDIIKGLAVTEVNYDVAVDRLFERFENSERLVTAYYEELKEIKFSSDPTEQRSNYDSIQKILKNLESVGITVDQDYLRTILMSKFSRDTLRRALREVKRKEDGTFTVSDLMPAIDYTLKIEEAIDLAHKGSLESKALVGKITTGTFVSGNRSQIPKKSNPNRTTRKTKLCIFCGETSHNSHMCLRFNSLARRRSILFRKGLCFTCLGSHKFENCPKRDSTCSLCGKVGHHLALCVSNMIENDKRRQQRTDEKKTGTPTTKGQEQGEFRSCPSSSFVKSTLPSNLKYADPDIFESEQRPFEILIGANLYNDLIDILNVKRLDNGIILLNSFFGWVTSGNTSSKPIQTSTLISGSSLDPKEKEGIIIHSSSEDHDASDLSDLTRLWSLETIGIKPTEIENEHDKVLDNFWKTARLENNRYITRWPFKHSNPELASNFRIARARLRSLLTTSNTSMLSAYNEVFKDYLTKGIIEPAPKETRYLLHYLPHRGIYQKNKIRIVFDASAKTKSGHSLNDLIFKGPPLQESIFKLLMNFRLHSTAITSDIEKAFLQVVLNEVDRDCVRFLWVRDTSKPAEGDNLIHYRFVRVPFGVIASPFLLNIVLQEHLSSNPKNQLHLLAQKSFC